MRKRPILFAAAVAVAGLAALGTVLAQQPSGYTPPPPVRPYNEWTPTAPPGAPKAAPQPVQPAGGAKLPGGAYAPPPGGVQPAVYPPPGNRPPLTRPGVAGPVQPAGGIDIPPPSMDLSGVGVPTKPSAAAMPPVPPPSGPLAPPSVSVDPQDSKFAPPAPPPAVPPIPTPPPAAPPAIPAAPAVPPAPVPFVPGGDTGAPVAPPAGLPATPVAPPGGAPNPLPLPTPPAGTPGVIPVPGTTPTPGTAPALPATGAPLPSRVSQSVTIQTVCPESVVYGADFTYEIIVRNTGNVAVQNVRVEDELPAGAKYVGSDPPGELNGERLVWAIGALEANTDKRITVRVRPTEEGELRSRAAVTYSAGVEARTKVTRPRIAVTVSAPEVVKAGTDAVFQVKVTNSGTGPAEKMILQAVMSDGLYFPQGQKLETRLASLAAGESNTISLPLNAIKAGVQTCQFTVTADGSPDTSARASVNVVEPLLQIAQNGPQKCLVRGEPTYEITLSNPGTATTDPITLHAVLPDGFEFVQASDAGAFNPTTRAVSWKLTGLAPNGSKGVALKLRAAAAGDVVLKTVAHAVPDAPAGAVPAGGAKPVGRVLEAKTETPIHAEGVAAVRFDVRVLDNPVEVGKEAVYEIRVMNQGTGACTNVQLLAAIPDGTAFTTANGHTAIKAQGPTLVFDPIPTLAVKGEAVYTVRLRGNQAGDVRFRVALTCDQVRTPVVKEESTRFYKE